MAPLKEPARARSTDHATLHGDIAKEQKLQCADVQYMSLDVT